MDSIYLVHIRHNDSTVETIFADDCVYSAYDAAKTAAKRLPDCFVYMTDLVSGMETALPDPLVRTGVEPWRVNVL